MKTIINSIKADWINVKNKCRTTVGKAPSAINTTSEFRFKLLLSEHSPVRLITVDWGWPGIKSWVATHWSRHVWECFIQTQRDDRTGSDRDSARQDSPVMFEGVANAQHLIDTMRKRLCYQAHTETRQYAESLRAEIGKQEPELAMVLVPNCVYRCGCPEFEPCGLFNGLYRTATASELSDIEMRYDVYNIFMEGGGELG